MPRPKFSGRTRIGGQAREDKRLRERNRPPAGAAWVWYSLDMMESPAWAALSLPARRVLDRLSIEHMNHGGTRNGDLVCTYSDFERFGIRRMSINQAIDEAVALGFVDVVHRGGLAHGVARIPSTYGLTWLHRADLTLPSQRWRRIADEAAAKAILAEVASRHKARPGPRARAAK